jgi:hypothetical protein
MVEMPSISVQRNHLRGALYLPRGQVKDDPSIVIPFYKLDRSELDFIARSQLADVGITDEATVQSVVDEAEIQYEQRRKEYEASKELRRLMSIRAGGGKLMSVGEKKWIQVFHPAVKSFSDGTVGTE